MIDKHAFKFPEHTFFRDDEITHKNLVFILFTGLFYQRYQIKNLCSNTGFKRM
jgi:hypothetical protein